MKHDFTSSEFFFDDELSDFDPYAGANEDLLDDATPEKPEENVEFEHPDLSLPPAERIEKLMSSMNSTARTLRAILRLCAEAQPVDAVNEFVDEVQKSNFSVYSAANLCRLLERAGGLERVNAEGELVTATDNEPRVVVVDGVECLEAPQPAPSFWRSTQDGLAHLEGTSAADKLATLLDENPAYLPIYKRILTLCARDEGAVATALASDVDNDPIVQDPRRYASYFVDKLEACDAIEWRNDAWHATQTGCDALRG